MTYRQEQVTSIVINIFTLGLLYLMETTTQWHMTTEFRRGAKLIKSPFKKWRNDAMFVKWEMDHIDTLRSGESSRVFGYTHCQIYIIGDSAYLFTTYGNLCMSRWLRKKRIECGKQTRRHAPIINL